MKKKYYAWWGYIKNVVRKYPEIKYEKGLNGVEERERDAVNGALEDMWKRDQGSTQTKVISMIHFTKTHTLTGAAQEIGCDRSTAARWQRKFFEDVAKNMGLLD